MAHPADNGEFDREFGFADPMRAIHWTYWQALAWIADRDAKSVRDCPESRGISAGCVGKSGARSIAR